MQASVRKTDRAVVQVGESLGIRTDSLIVLLTQQNVTDLRAAFNQPHGLVYLAEDGTVTFDPYVAPVPVPLAAREQAAIDRLKATFNTARTAAQINACIDDLSVLMRRVYRELE